MTPGRLLHRFAARWFAPETTANIIEPLVADWQHEVASAAVRSERQRAVVRGYIFFWRTAVACEARSLSKGFAGLRFWFVEPNPARTMAAWLLVLFFGIGAARSWIQTGVFDPGAGMYSLLRSTAIWPSAFVGVFWRHANGVRARTWFALIYIAAVGAAMAIAPPADRLAVVAINAAGAALMPFYALKLSPWRDRTPVSREPDENEPPTATPA